MENEFEGENPANSFDGILFETGLEGAFKLLKDSEQAAITKSFYHLSEATELAERKDKVNLLKAAIQETLSDPRVGKSKPKTKQASA